MLAGATLTAGADETTDVTVGAATNGVVVVLELWRVEAVRTDCLAPTAGLTTVGVGVVKVGVSTGSDSFAKLDCNGTLAVAFGFVGVGRLLDAVNVDEGLEGTGAGVTVGADEGTNAVGAGGAC